MLPRRAALRAVRYGGLLGRLVGETGSGALYVGRCPSWLGRSWATRQRSQQSDNQSKETNDTEHDDSPSPNCCFGRMSVP